MSRTSRVILSFLFILLTASRHVFASPQTEPSSSISRDAQPRACGFPGNPDIYGPGIRIGIYTQNIAVYLAKYFIPSQSPIIRDSLTVFTVALLIVSFVFASHPSSTYAVEFFIILQILSWNCLTGVRALNTYSAKLMKDRMIKTIAVEGIDIVVLSFHVWFWWAAISWMESGECGDRAWFFLQTSS